MLKLRRIHSFHIAAQADVRSRLSFEKANVMHAYEKFVKKLTVLFLFFFSNMKNFRLRRIFTHIWTPKKWQIWWQTKRSAGLICHFIKVKNTIFLYSKLFSAETITSDRPLPRFSAKWNAKITKWKDERVFLPGPSKSPTSRTGALPPSVRPGRGTVCRSPSHACFAEQLGVSGSLRHYNNKKLNFKALYRIKIVSKNFFL